MTRIHRLLKLDYQKREDFANWVLINYDEDKNFSENIIFSDEACFSMHGDINSQNCRFWSKENPGQIFEVPPHNQKVVV